MWCFSISLIIAILSEFIYIVMESYSSFVCLVYNKQKNGELEINFLRGRTIRTHKQYSINLLL